MKKKNKIVITLILIIFFILVAVYVAGWMFFGTRYLPNTWINGRDFSFETPEEVEDVLNREVRTWALAVDTMYNGREGISAKEIDMAYKTDGSAQRFLEEQNSALWFLNAAGKKDLRIEEINTFSEERLREAVEGLKCMQKENVEEPADAYILIEGDEFTVVPEVTGNKPDLEKVVEVISNAARECILEVNLEDEGCYVKPEVTADSPVITTSMQNLENFREAYITLDFAVDTETIDWELVKNWVTTDEDGYYVMDKKKVSSYVKGLAEKYNTIGMTREFLTYDNRKIAVEGGDYGWVLDEEQETLDLITELLHGTVEVIDPVFAVEAGNRSSTNDIGSTYIEIDLDNQRMVYYEAGKPVIDTGIISGFPHDEATMTPTGTYILRTKVSPGTIVDNWDTQDVYFLLGFGEDLAISDATWRLEFGGDVYYWEGTDGSIEVPLEEMDKLYQAVSEGTAIVIYN